MDKFLSKLVLLLLFIGLAYQVQYQRVFSSNAHTDLVVTASFFADNQRMITGSNDRTVKVWSLINFSVLHTFTLTDVITNVGLHPTDNRIFILVFDGNINVYDQTTYALLNTITFTGSYNPNYLVFDTVNNRFMIGGFNGGTPAVYFYDSTTYAAAGNLVTGLPSGDEVNTMSINAQNTHLAVTNLDYANANIAQIQFYNLNTNTLISTFTYGTKVKWAIYDNVGSYLCSTFTDQNVKCYRYDSTNNIYVLDKSWSVASLSMGYPYCMNFGITNQLILTIGPNIAFFDMLATPNPTKLLSYADAEDIFVLDSNSNMDYLVAAGRNGLVSIWKQIPAIPDPIVTPVQNTNLGLIIGLAVGIPVFLILLAIIIYCCFFGAGKRWRQRKLQNIQSMKIQNGFQTTQNQIASFLKPLQLQDKYIIIKGDQHSDKSSQPDYDQLMANGTIIIIKDEKKKKQYVKKLNKKRKKHHKKHKDNLKTQDQSISSLDNKQLAIEGHIIIIRDNNNPIKNKNNNKNFNQNPNYDQLMAQENIIIIRDQQLKKKLVNKLKQNNKNINQNQFNYIMAEQTIIIIKDSQEQKKLIKQLKKQNDLNRIKHDEILANGDMIIIKDQQKKKSFINSIKEDIKKNNQKDIDYQALDIAQQIIIIRGNDDINDTDQLTYQQLLAQGTVIVIRDQQVKKQYIKHKNQNNNRYTKQDYQMMMAEQCIIVIREDDDKKDYVDFLKKRDTKTQKSSSIGYDELMEGNIMTIKEQGKKNQKKLDVAQKSIKKDIEIDPNYKQIVAQKNVIAIKQDDNQISVKKNTNLIKIQSYGQYQINYQGPRQQENQNKQRKSQINPNLLMPNPTKE